MISHAIVKPNVYPDSLAGEKTQPQYAIYLTDNLCLTVDLSVVLLNGGRNNFNGIHTY